MFFLLRTAFWLTLVLALIPLGTGREDNNTQGVDPTSAFFAASAAVSDIGNFCQRNPQACETGGEALAMVGARAADGARIVYEFLDTRMATRESGGSQDQEPAGDLITGSVSTGTLTAQDLTTPWQGQQDSVSSTETEIGPVPRPNPRHGQRT